MLLIARLVQGILTAVLLFTGLIIFGLVFHIAWRLFSIGWRSGALAFPWLVVQ